MKTKLIGPIREQIPAGKVLLYGGSDGNPEGFQGIVGSAEGIDNVANEFRIPIKAKRNQAVGFRHENEPLPAPGSSSFTYLSEPMRHEYGLFNLSGQLLKASASGEQAFKPAFKAEMEDLTTSVKLDVNRAAYGDGSGKLANVSTTGVATDTQVAVDSTINFRGDEIIDFTSASGTVVSAAHVVTAIDRVTKRITVSPALAGTVTSGTHFPVRASASSTAAIPNNSLNREIQGLSSIVSSTGTLHGLNPATYNFWKSYTDTAVGTLNDQVLRRAKDGIGFETGVDIDGGLNFAILTTRGARSRYADTLTALKRFNNAESVKLRGGFTALMFDENPIFVDDQCPVGNVWGLSLRHFFWVQNSDWEWMEEDGNVLKWNGRDGYTAVLFKYCQLGTSRRGTHFRLTGATDDDR